MKLDDLQDRIDELRYNKHRMLFLTGDKRNFEGLVEGLGDCRMISVRSVLLEACRERGIQGLDGEKTKQLVEELLPRPGPGESVALMDNELLLKHDVFSTTMKSQRFQNRVYLVHIPSRYKDIVKNTELVELG